MACACTCTTVGPGAETAATLFGPRRKIPVRYHNPAGLDSARLVASQWTLSPPPGTVREELWEAVIRPVLVREGMDMAADTRIKINPEGPVAKVGPPSMPG